METSSRDKEAVLGSESCVTLLEDGVVMEVLVRTKSYVGNIAADEDDGSGDVRTLRTHEFTRANELSWCPIRSSLVTIRTQHAHLYCQPISLYCLFQACRALQIEPVRALWSAHSGGGKARSREVR
jgi:hypothetical protein